MFRKFLLWLFVTLALLAAGPLPAWDYDGHRIVNQLALASLPTNFPAFALTPAARERVTFLAGEPDRWRNTSDQPLKHFNGPDHFLDLDRLPLYDLTPQTASPFRYEFMAQLALARAQRPDRFPAIVADQDADRTKALIGFLPWAINENYAKLKSGFSSLKTLEAYGRPEEVENARQNVLYVMGVMGHYVGDGAQPLHTTKHYNGWIGDNPHHYTTNKTFHSWIDGGFLGRVGIKTNDLLARVRPARLLWSGDPRLAHTNAFAEVMDYLLAQHQLVETLYQLDRDQKLHPGDPRADEGREFLSGQLLKAGQMLGDLWFSAWQQAGPDTFLQSQLVKRQLGSPGTNGTNRGPVRREKPVVP